MIAGALSYVLNRGALTEKQVNVAERILARLQREYDACTLLCQNTNRKEA
jgi:hypothetical protein